MKQRFLNIVSILSLTLMLATGLNFAQAAPAPAPTNDQPLVFNLNIDCDQNGVLSVMGLTSADLNLLTGRQLQLSSGFQPEIVAQMQSMGVNKIRVQVGKEGGYLYANDDKVPGIKWSTESLNAAIDLLPLLNVSEAQQAALRKFAGAVVNSNISATINFPPTTVARPTYQEPEANVEPDVVMKFKATFDENGKPSFVGFTPEDFNLSLTMDVDVLHRLQASNIKRADFRLYRGGAVVTINNGKELPSLAWDRKSLAIMIGLVTPFLNLDKDVQGWLQRLPGVMDKIDVGVSMVLPPAK